MLYPTSVYRFRRGGQVLPLLAVTLLALLVPRHAEAQWRIDAWLGDAWSAPTNVTFVQAGEPDISATGHWSTQPFAPTWYYGGRISSWKGNSGWGFEYLHHKIYMDNPPPQVEFFRVTNGVNLFLPERLWRRHGWEFNVGAGPVMVVPVSKVRGLEYDNANGIFDSRYEFGGGAIAAGISRRLRLLPFTFGEVAIQGSAAYVRGRIVNGHATTMNYALHIQYGLSVQTKSR
jgi:hypothetical protein